jgi:predicted HicB family RNase H-like nuclease
VTDRKKYRLGPDVRPDEELRDSQGRIVDDAYVDEAVEEAIQAVRGRGRPSLSQTGESPLLRVRISRELDDAVRRAAENSGASRSEWVRRVLDEASRKAS